MRRSLLRGYQAITTGSSDEDKKGGDMASEMASEMASFSLITKN